MSSLKQDQKHADGKKEFKLSVGLLKLRQPRKWSVFISWATESLRVFLSEVKCNLIQNTERRTSVVALKWLFIANSGLLHYWQKVVSDNRWSNCRSNHPIKDDVFSFQESSTTNFTFTCLLHNLDLTRHRHVSDPNLVTWKCIIRYYVLT